jgi:hypothetical protein
MATEKPTDLISEEDLSQANVLREVVRKLGGLDRFTRMVAEDYMDSVPGSNARARIGTMLLQALLKHGTEDEVEDEDLASLEAELKALME